jgi:osmoprotectant transport system ATP-binding protein
MTESSPPLLELDRAAKDFAGVTALHPTTLAIETGHTTVLIGPSGCGKTTALRLMLGLTAPDRGRVRLRGVELDARALALERQRMGYVVQDGGLFPHLTALGNVSLMARYLGWLPDLIRGRVRELAELVRLPLPSLERYPAELSGGQQQRVALMRALMLDPELLFLDEPLGALDPLVRAELQDDLRAVFARLGKTVVLVTHDLAEAALFAHVIVLMKDGQVVQQGSLDDLLERPADPFVTRFVRAQRRFGSHRDREPMA